MDKLLVFKTYAHHQAAEQAAALLRERGIEAEASREARVLDSVYIGQQFNDPYLLYIPGKDFERANVILEENMVIRLDEVDPGYELLSFSDEELIDVMRKKEEWGAYNYKLAEALLQQRDVPIPQMDIVWAQVESLKEKEKPVSSGMRLLLLGYASALGGTILGFMRGGNAVFTLFPGLLAFFIGWHLAYSRLTLSDGKQTYYFNNSTRLHGVFLFWLSVIVAALKFIFLLLIAMQQS